MTTRSATLAADTFPGGSATTVVATVPVGETWIVKQADVWLTSFLNSSVQLYWRRANGAQGIFVQQSIVSPFIAHFVGWSVGEPGDELVAFGSNADFYLWVSGTRLQGVAP